MFSLLADLLSDPWSVLSPPILAVVNTRLEVFVGIGPLNCLALSFLWENLGSQNIKSKAYPYKGFVFDNLRLIFVLFLWLC